MNILYLAPIPFEYLKQRPQYMAEELARKHLVYYVEPTISLASAAFNKDTEYRQSSKKIAKRLYVIRLDGRCSLPYRLKFMDMFCFSAFFEYIQLVIQLKKIDLVLVAYPGWFGVVKYFSKIRVVYDIMDDYVHLAGDKGTRAFIKYADKKLQERAEIILTSSRLFYKRLYRKRDHVFLIPNALPNQYKQKSMDQSDRNNERAQTVYGYVGVIAQWFDWSVIEYLANMANSRLILAGPALVPVIHRENIIYTGQIPKKDVPQIIKKCDVCLYPFISGTLLDSINPVKIYEYLAFKKPVIAKRSMETEQFANMISLYDSKDDFKQILKEGVKKPFSNPDEYRTFISQNSWSARVEQMNRILEEN